MRKAHKLFIFIVPFIFAFSKAIANNNDSSFIGLNAFEPQYNFKSIYSEPPVSYGHLHINPWIFLGTYFLVIVLYLVLKNKYNFSIKSLFTLAISPKFLKVPYDELNNQLRFPINLLFILAVVINSAFIYASSKILNFPASTVTLTFTSISVAILILGYLYNVIISLIFENNSLGLKLLLVYKIFFIVVAYTMFFLLFVVNYVPKPLLISTIYLGVAVFIFFYIVKIISQLYAFKFENFSIFHFILYICTVEIIPVLIALSILKQ